MLEVCCGGYYDGVQAYLGGAKRIELNSALYLGGLTPSLGSLELVKQNCPGLKVIAMVRPRGAGFFYSQEDFQVMEQDCSLLLAHGADGIAFGCLRADGALDIGRNRRMIDRIHESGREAVFHRAFDCCGDPYQAMEALIGLGADRVLTSGCQPTAVEGSGLLRSLQRQYGGRIEILAGSGINAGNVAALMGDTGITQLHSSCKGWHEDPTTIGAAAGYGYAPVPHSSCYEAVQASKVRELLEAMGEH